MKKKYNVPAIAIARFNVENILTDSTSTTDFTNAVKDSLSCHDSHLKIQNRNDEALAIITF